MTEADPCRKIVYSWRYGGLEGDSTVSWEMTGEGENSRLTFSHTAIKRFDTDDPLFCKENCQSGWEFFLNGQLPAFFQND